MVRGTTNRPMRLSMLVHLLCLLASAMKENDRQSPWTSLSKTTTTPATTSSTTLIESSSPSISAILSISTAPSASPRPTASFSPTLTPTSSRSPAAAMPIATTISLQQEQMWQKRSASPSPLSTGPPAIEETRQDVLSPTETAPPTTSSRPTITSHPSISAQPISPTISPQPTQKPTLAPTVTFFTTPPISSSDAPTSINPTSLPPSTASPVSDSPISDSPVSDSPTTDSPVSSAPTSAPTTATPTTDYPTTNSPSTSNSPSTAPSTMPTISVMPSTSPTTSPTISNEPTTVYFPSYGPSMSIKPTTSSPTTTRPTTTTLPTTLLPTMDDANARRYTIESSMTFYYSTCNGSYCRNGGRMSAASRQNFIDNTQNVILLETLLIVGDDGNGLIVIVDPIYDDDDDEEEEEGRQQQQQQRQSKPYDLILRRQLEPDDDAMTTTGGGGGGVPYTLILPFNVTIEFNSQRYDWDPNHMVSVGFILPQDQESYIQSLKDTNDDGTFTYIERMSMIVDGTLITTTTDGNGGGGGSNSTDPLPDINNNNNNDNQLYYIIAGSVGGSLLILIIGIIFYRAGRDSRVKEEQLQQQQQQQLHQQQPQFSISDIVRPVPMTQHDRVPSDAFDIIAQRQNTHHNGGWNNNNNNTGFGDILSGTDDDDISTLGEPYLGPMMNSLKRNNNDGIGEQSVISAGQEMYVYGTRSRLNTKDDVTSLKSSSKKSILFGDDVTLENAYANNPYMKGTNIDGGDGSAIRNYTRIVINAPRGALGIVIDNVTGDLPILHAIRETSILHSQVFVGDLLLSVDEVDCRGLTAVQVSRLISGRSENSSRKLTLLRPSHQ